MKKLLLLTALMALNGILFAQSPHLCAVDSLLKSLPDYEAKTNAFAAELAEFRNHTPVYHRFLPNGIEPVGPTAGCQDAVYIIPVVVHIDTTGGTVNVSDTQVVQQIAIMNAAFAPHGIRFVLAKKKPGGASFSGITRFGGSFDYRYTHLANSYASSSSHYFDPAKYFNLYVAPDILASNGNPSTINGFDNIFADQNSSLPDMVVVRHTKFGNYTTCNSCGTLTSDSRGLIAVHEAGHYLGLRELWQGGCGEGNTALTCSKEGDLCCDTRPVNANYLCSDTGGNDCSYHLNISDNHQNYMDYTDDDCLNNFTPEQVSLMYATLELYRNTLISPQNLNLLDLNDCFATAWLEAESNFSCDSADFVLHAVEYDNATSYRWIIKLDTQILLDTILSVHTLTWQKASAPFGKYNVTLELTYDSTDIAKVTRFNYLEVADCGTIIGGEQGNWFFGKYAGLKFTPGGPVRDINPDKIKVPDNINTSEGTISHSDSAGNLLFYGGGTLNAGDFELFNRNYQPMPGSPVIGDYSACQAGAVVKVPGQTGKYYLFTVSGNDAVNLNGFRYSIIDMALDGGNGAIVSASKNTPIKGPVGMEHSPLDSALTTSEQITLIPKCGGNSYWVLVTNGYGQLNTDGIRILVFELDAVGIRYHSQSNESLVDDPNAYTKIGQIKASPDGNWVFLWQKLFRFDKSTGILSLYRDSLSQTYISAASFSPESRFLYLVEEDADNDKISRLYQLNLQSSNDSLNKTFVSGYPFEASYANLQLGPDQRIYLSKYNYSSLAVINKPDSVCTGSTPNACNYSFNGPVLAQQGIGGISVIGLPNMRDAKLASAIDLDFLAVDSNCGTVSFYPNTPCQLSYLWYFGDGDSSTLEGPVHTYMDTGFYTVTLIVNGTDTIQHSLYIGIQANISGSSIACLEQDDAAGYSIAGRNAQHHYTWEVFGGTIASVDPFDNLNVSWDSSGSVMLMVVNPLNGCRAYDTLYVDLNILSANSITNSVSSCFPAVPVGFDGTAVSATFGTIHYQWQISYDSLNWLDTDIADTLEDLSLSELDSTTWYRRKASALNCHSYSNTIKLVPDPQIVQDLTTIATCGPDPESHSFPLVLANSNGDIQLEFNHYREISTGNWGWTTGSLVNYPNSFPTNVNEGDSVKIRIVRSGCEQYSQTVPVSRVRLVPDNVVPTIPYVLNMTVTQDYININLGTPTVITASLFTSLQWLQSAGNGDEFFQWQKCQTLIYGGSTPWADIPGANNDTLFLNGEYCDRGNYRVILRAFWEGTNACIDFIPPDFASVSIPEKIWSKDGAADTAAEPNTDPNNDYWNSPHLWNCWKSLNCSTHESPEYLSTDSNQVRATILNTGQSGSGPFRVFLYWTLGGFYEKWPVSWHLDLTNNGFYNPNTGLTYPMGSEIDSIDISGMPGGTSITVSAMWDEPYPGWYDTSSYYNGQQVKHPLCFLSRIVTCDEDPYGMTINEIESTGDNVINNNNIVTRNTEISDSIAFNKKTPVYVLRTGNQSGNPRRIRMELENVISNFWTLGYFTVRFDGNIYDAWDAGGQSGANYQLSGDEFKITGDGFYLDNIVLDGDEWGWMYVQFHLHPSVSITTYQGTQLFSFVQSSCDTTSESYQADGGFNFLLNLLPVVYTPPEMTIPESNEQNAGQDAGFLSWEQNETEGEMEGSQPQRKGTDGKKAGAMTVTSTAKAYPNPSSGIIYFDLNLEVEREISIELYDGLGKKIREIPHRAYPMGKHTLRLDGSQLAPGPYLAKIQVNGEVKTITVIITR